MYTYTVKYCAQLCPTHCGPTTPLSVESSNQEYWNESVLMRLMKLEPIIQSEVSQKDKDHYNILTHIYGI